MASASVFDSQRIVPRSLQEEEEDALGLAVVEVEEDVVDLEVVAVEDLEVAEEEEVSLLSI